MAMGVLSMVAVIPGVVLHGLLMTMVLVVFFFAGMPVAALLSCDMLAGVIIMRESPEAHTTPSCGGSRRFEE